jgi:hypothetical protein
LNTVGAWEATCDEAAAEASRKIMQMGNVHFIVVILIQKLGEGSFSPLPAKARELENGSL